MCDSYKWSERSVYIFLYHEICLKHCVSAGSYKKKRSCPAVFHDMPGYAELRKDKNLDAQFFAQVIKKTRELQCPIGSYEALGRAAAGC